MHSAQTYRIWGWGGARDKYPDVYDVGVSFVAKDPADNPNTIFNELVCMELGRYLGLPIPIGMVLQRNNQFYFCSAHCSAVGAKPPPADLDQLSKEKPELMCGIALFDAWVCNADRHSENMFFDPHNDVVLAWDHERALLSDLPKIKHLQENEDFFDFHAEFGNVVADFDSFPDWYDHLLRIPEKTILCTLIRATGFGVDTNTATLVSEFLIARRSKLRRMFAKQAPMFPKFKKTLFTQFGDSDHDPTEYSI